MATVMTAFHIGTTILHRRNCLAHGEIMIKFAIPQIGDEEKGAVLKVLDSGRLTDGPMVEEFERMFGEIHGGYAVAVSSATAGLHLLFRDVARVIIPAMTHIATANAARNAGCEIKFADCGPDGNMTDEAIFQARKGFEDAAVCGLHYLGKPCEAKIDMVDSALHIGHQIKVPSVFSFYPAKQMTSCEGGMVVTKDHAQAERIRCARAFGRERLGVYRFASAGLNYRMSEVHAAIGIEQLKKLPGFLAKRRANWETLRAGIEGEVIESMPGSAYAFGVVLESKDERDGMKRRLLEEGVETSIHYETIVPAQPCYGSHQWGWPGARRIADRVLCLPVGPHLGAPDMHHIARAFNLLRKGELV